MKTRSSSKKSLSLKATPENTLDYYSSVVYAFQTLLTETRTQDSKNLTDYLAVFEARRKSPLYQQIASLVLNQEEFTIAEYLYYALITDDVSQLNSQKLAHCHEIEVRANAQNEPKLWKVWKVIEPFTDNIKILIAALEYSRGYTPESNPDLCREVIQQQLKELSPQLSERLRIRENKRYNGGLATPFLNLSRIKLPYLYLENESLTYCDLTGANLNYALLANVELNYTCLNQASFTSARLTMTRVTESFLNKINFSGSTVDISEFDHSSLCDADLSSTLIVSSFFNECTFDGSSFNGADLGPHNLRTCSLNHCAFDEHTTCFNLGYLDLPTAFLDTDFRKLDWKGKNYLPLYNANKSLLIHPQEKFTSVTEFNALLNTLHPVVYHYSGLNDHGASSNPTECAEDKIKANTAAASYATNLVCHINLYARNPHVDRAALLQEALNHKLFYDYGSHIPIANVITGNILTLFRSLRLSQPTAAQLIFIEAIKDPDFTCNAALTTYEV